MISMRWVFPMVSGELGGRLAGPYAGRSCGDQQGLRRGFLHPGAQPRQLTGGLRGALLRDGRELPVPGAFGRALDDCPAGLDEGREQAQVLQVAEQADGAVPDLLVGRWFIRCGSSADDAWVRRCAIDSGRRVFSALQSASRWAVWKTSTSAA